MSERFAIYYAPPRESLCWTLGTAWLGRDPETGEEPVRLQPDGLDLAALDEITHAPAHYGFHATLKPPFALAPGETRGALEEALAAFSAGRSAFLAPAPRVVQLGGCIALVPGTPDGRISTLAEDCVRAFDRFRAPLSPEDMARRQASGLSARQAILLGQWGYPYVMDQFRFHMTLSGRLEDGRRERVLTALQRLFAPACAQRLQVSGIALYRQASRESPFELVDRFPFASGG